MIAPKASVEGAARRMGLKARLWALHSSSIAPFHDDKTLQAFIEAAVAELGIKTFVETGTFRADSLKWFAEAFPEIRCFSCETKRLFYWYSFLRTFRIKNVSIHPWDSREFLGNIAFFVKEPALFWLDAHWENDWPILGEIRMILKRYGKALILIDDLEIPGKPGFGYDSYKGQALNLDYVRQALSTPCEVWLPDYDPPKDARGVAAVFVGVKGSGAPWFKRAL